MSDVTFSHSDFSSLCIAAAAAARRIDPAAIRSPRRERAPIAAARQLALYLHHVVFNASLSACGRALRRDRASVRHACAVIEDRRDDPRFDRAVAALEAGLSAQRDLVSSLLVLLGHSNDGRSIMTKRQRSIPDALERAGRRLLAALEEPGARALRGQIDESAIVVVAPRNGVTVVRASLPIGAADLVASQGLARWDGEGEARRLLLTEEGRAQLRRGAAPAEADPFRAQHSSLARLRVEEGAAPLVNEGESPLAWLARRKDRDGRPFLAPEQVEAGERFRRDVTQAQLLQRVTADWEASGGRGRNGGAGGAPVAEVAMDARRRLSRAFDAVGPDLAGLLTDVCGYLKGLALVESERGWPHRSAKVVLKIALERLALHYGLASEARGPAQARHLLHWGAEDYRPEA